MAKQIVLTCIFFVVGGSLQIIQGCSPKPPSITLQIPATKFPADLISAVIEYTPGNKMALTQDKVKIWRDTLQKINLVGYRPIPNSKKRSLMATFVFLDADGRELFQLDQWEDGNISFGNEFFSIK